MIFQWDSKKAAANKLKHGVGFEEARTAFDDTGAVLQADPLHSDDEDRFVLIGLSIVPRLLIVVHCARFDGDVCRLISARLAAAHEAQIYYESQS